MEPRNKFQQRVVEASKTLPKLTKAQVKWAYKNCIEHIGHKSAKGVITCLDCGHQWTDKGLTDEYTNCPHCNLKLKIEATRKRCFLDYEYLCIVTACNGFQVLRFLYVECKMKVGEEPQYYHSEVVQRWIAPDGKYATLAKLRPMGFFGHTWNWWSDLEIRPDKSLYNITPTEIYPRQKLIPEIKRSGFNGDFYNLTPFDLFHYILTENRAETLLKAGQIGLLQYFAYHTSRNISDYWASVKIATRNRYTPSDAGAWCDYIELLRFFGKDLHNTKYVCPDNLRAEHDRYVQKKKAWSEQVRKEESKKKALEDETKFQEMKSRFFGVQFSDGLIQIRVLESVQEVMAEAEAMHHCLFSNNYHLKPDSLILSACIDGKRVETIEISLSALKVLQSQGVCNQMTEYHNRIIKLVNKNIPLIQKRLSA